MQVKTLLMCKPFLVSTKPQNMKYKFMKLVHSVLPLLNIYIYSHNSIMHTQHNWTLLFGIQSLNSSMRDFIQHWEWDTYLSVYSIQSPFCPWMWYLHLNIEPSQLSCALYILSMHLTIALREFWFLHASMQPSHQHWSLCWLKLCLQGPVRVKLFISWTTCKYKKYLLESSILTVVL